jgi:hypothetical protein
MTYVDEPSIAAASVEFYPIGAASCTQYTGFVGLRGRFSRIMLR